MRRNEISFGVVQFDTTYTVANLPSAAQHKGALVFVSNGDAGSPCLAVSDGTNWKKIALGATVSAS